MRTRRAVLVGACLMLGYFDNQQATEESFNREGWFMSGDLGRFVLLGRGEYGEAKS